jgi:hypothetical protein
MSAMWTAVIAVVGTLVGSLGGATATYYFQSRTTRHSEAVAREGRQRQERLEASSTLAVAVMDLRAAQYSRRFSGLSERPGDDRSAVRTDSSRLRSVAWSSFFVFKLTSPGERLVLLAEQAVEEAADLTKADDEADLKRRSEQARRRFDEFVSEAAADLAGTAAAQGLVGPGRRLDRIIKPLSR